MSHNYSRRQAVARTQAVARNAAQDSLIGAALGLVLVSGFLASNLDAQQMMADSQHPLGSLAAIVLVIVAQAAVAVTLGGAAIRWLVSND